ncbi:adenylate/guanylate cyclase domain-containing protein [Flavobacterium sp. CSZ]|uniref:adenylate/guanylate cyclase domain-containing protein n=1 Tax=Flavobacterium sp. CSZ TaxID=2783791 RepID=UPI00188DA808|nr:adenylate/guanylate cyclase domain-containing protein [Flavobacterium sp. CSZ]MBF4485598.1 adenylate/guanylate cyclase domain-containing protein [Flavobacterium sp. CSZ]
METPEEKKTEEKKENVIKSSEEKSKPTEESKNSFTSTDSILKRGTLSDLANSTELKTPRKTLTELADSMELTPTRRTLTELADSFRTTKRYSTDYNVGHALSNFARIPENDSYLNTLKSFNQPSLDNQMKLVDEITELKRKLVATTKELSVQSADKQKVLDNFDKLNTELKAKEKINHIIPRIREEAREKLLVSSEFLALFEDAKSCDAVVVSIDIRRSTELMLKARKPELFSKFITELSSKLSENIIGNYGIFDKFTGDGILAFFPKFYSGEDAIVRALKSAEECHEIFDKHYHDSKSCFNVFINDVGLGIGIDYGTVTLVNTSNELTVVGIPVVYACRMSGAKAGDTILNQPAKEEIEKICSTQIKLIDTTISIKNEGTAEVYKVEVNKSVYNSLEAPEWIVVEDTKTVIEEPRES